MVQKKGALTKTFRTDATGEPEAVLLQLEALLGPSRQLDELADCLKVVAPAAAEAQVELQLDPTFQPHFDLYDGLVLKLVCQGLDAPVEIASGTPGQLWYLRCAGEDT